MTFSRFLLWYLMLWLRFFVSQLIVCCSSSKNGIAISGCVTSGITEMSWDFFFSYLFFKKSLWYWQSPPEIWRAWSWFCLAESCVGWRCLQGWQELCGHLPGSYWDTGTSLLTVWNHSFDLQQWEWFSFETLLFRELMLSQQYAIDKHYGKLQFMDGSCPFHSQQCKGYV